MDIKFETNKPKLLDLYCCAGGMAKGYTDAGFEVVGVDIIDRPHYPYKFIKADALEILKNRAFVEQFDAIHASPPCQCYTKLKYLSGDVDKWEESHPDLVPPTRKLLKTYDKPWVIENVPGAPLINPIRLYGSQFENLYTQRERWFESNIKLVEPETPMIRHKTPKLGEGFGEDGYITVAGNKCCKGMNRIQTKLYYGFALGGIDWMDLEELTQAIPPQYAEFIGKQLIKYIAINKKPNVKQQPTIQVTPELINNIVADVINNLLKGGN